MATITESKEAVLRVMRGDEVEKVLDGLLEQPVDQADQDAPSEPTIEDYGPEELEQMANASNDAMTKMEAVYGEMLKHDRGTAEESEEAMDEMRSAADRSGTDPIEGGKEMYKAMASMEQALGDEPYEGSDQDSADVHTVMGEMHDAYEGFNIKLGGSSDETDPGADGETSPGEPGGGVKVDVSGIPGGKGARAEDDDEEDPEDEMPSDDDDDEEMPPEEDDEEEPEDPEAELGMDDEEPEPEEDELDMDDEEPGEEVPGEEPSDEPEEQGEECPVCGTKMEWSEDAEMDQCAECGYENPRMEQDDEPPAEEPSDEEPEPEDEIPDDEEQDGEPEDGEEATEARACPHCRQPMKEDTQRGKNVCTFCKFELDLGA